MLTRHNLTTAYLRKVLADRRFAKSTRNLVYTILRERRQRWGRRRAAGKRS